MKYPAGLVALLVALVACAAPSKPIPVPSMPPSTSSPLSSAAPAPATGAPAEAPVAGDIPDNQVFVPYSPDDRRFSVSVPEGWSRTDTGGVVVFTDKFNSVTVETVPRPSAPDVTSARDEVPQIGAATPGFRPGDVTQVTRKGGPAVLITYTAMSPVDPVTGKTVTISVERYEFWRGGLEAILTLTGPLGADNVDPWRIVSDSFRWQP